MQIHSRMSKNVETWCQTHKSKLQRKYKSRCKNVWCWQICSQKSHSHSDSVIKRTSSSWRPVNQEPFPRHLGSLVWKILATGLQPCQLSSLKQIISPHYAVGWSDSLPHEQMENFSRRWRQTHTYISTGFSWQFPVQLGPVGTLLCVLSWNLLSRVKCDGIGMMACAD